MRFHPTPLEGCAVIELDFVRDARGYFARTFCAEEFAAHGLTSAFVQSSMSFSRRKGTLRGLHFQAAPAMEDKLVSCDRGAAFDVALDLRPASPTFGRWYALELSEAGERGIYIPSGFAHGFQTLRDDTRIVYHITPAYQAELSAGIRWDDPDVQVSWPLPPTDVSERDLGLPGFADLDRSLLVRTAR
jgi:dTDP-4-dehydrorhamnose 3,5-epimerase